MAKCLITEAENLHRQFVDGQAQMPVIRPVLTQAVTYTSSVQSAAFTDDTAIIRVISDAEVFLAFGSNPTADANSVRLPANTVEYFGVLAGEKVACYDGVT